MDVIEAISTPPIRIDALHWSQGGDILAQSGQKCFIISPRPAVKGLGLVGCILFDASQEDVDSSFTYKDKDEDGFESWINDPRFIISSRWSSLGAAWDGGCAAALLSASGCLSIHEPPLSGIESRWPISCKIAGVRCVEWMPSTLGTSTGSTVLAVGNSNGLELLSLNKTHQKPLSLPQGWGDERQGTVIYHEESKEEHIEKIAWSNHVISWKNGEKTFRAILLTAVTSSGNIVLYRVKQAEGNCQPSSEILRRVTNTTRFIPQALVMTVWSNNVLKYSGEQLVGVAVADVMQITVYWLKVPLPNQSSSLVGLGSFISSPYSTTLNTSWKAHDLTICTIELCPPRDDESGTGTLTLFSSSLDGTIKEWELTHPFVMSGSSSSSPAPPNTYRTLLGGDKELPILGCSWSPGRQFIAVMRLQRKNVVHSSFLKSFHILEKGHTRVSVHLAPGGGGQFSLSSVETLGRVGDARQRLLREVVWIHSFSGNEPYLKAIEDGASEQQASNESLRVKHTLVCSQEGLGPSSTEALKLRWKLLRRWCEGCLKLTNSSLDHQYDGSNTFLMRQLVRKVGDGEEMMGAGDEASTQTLKEFCDACKSEVLPFCGSEDREDPLKATCPRNHVTLRCMRTLRICSDSTSVLTCPSCSSICLVTFPIMPCLFCETVLC